MKDDFMNQFFQDEKNNNYGNDPDNEIGVAINEQPQASLSQKEPRYDEKPEDDFLFSSHENEPEEEEEEEEQLEPGEEKGGLAFAESSKERLIDKIKGNLIYIFIALILIVPGSMKLYSLFTGGGTSAPTQKEQNINFTGGTPAPEVAPQEKPATNEQAKEVKPAENAVRSTSNKAAPIGGGSEAPSGNMPIQKEESTAEKPAKTTAVANILGTNEQAGSEQILDRYFAQESKVEQQLSELLGRLDDIEARLATLDDMDKRLTTLENNTTAPSSEELKQVLNRVGQLEQSVNQLKQQPKAPAAPRAPVPNANQPSASGAAAGISVEAVIPGRAWVRNRDGVLMVVEVGDEIPGVGKVTRIDAREGIVATTTQVFKQ